MSSSKGTALRHIKTGPIEVMTRVTDFNIQTVTGPNGDPIDVPATTLVAFSAVSFRELGDNTDEWEFVTMVPSRSGEPAKAYVYLSGADIFMIRAMSRVA